MASAQSITHGPAARPAEPAYLIPDDNAGCASRGRGSNFDNNIRAVQQINWDICAGDGNGYVFLAEAEQFGHCDRLYVYKANLRGRNVYDTQTIQIYSIDTIDTTLCTNKCRGLEHYLNGNFGDVPRIFALRVVRRARANGKMGRGGQWHPLRCSKLGRGSTAIAGQQGVSVHLTTGRCSVATTTGRC